MDLSVRIGRLELKNPILTGSGTFGYGIEFEEYFDIGMLGGVVVKGLSLRYKEGNPPPRICETPCGLLNSIGLQNVGIEKFYEEKLPLLRGKDCRIILNILGDNFLEYEKICEFIAGRGEVDGIEVNVSCPNVKKGGIHISKSPDAIFSLTEKLRKILDDIPLLIKLSPNVSDIVPFVEAVKDGGADGVTLSNTYLGIAIDLDTLSPKLSQIKGGLSGPAIKPLSQRIVFESASSVDIPIVASGGILNFRDALEYIALGAVAVEIGTANFLNPESPLKILKGMENYLEERGYTSVKDFVGIFLKKNGINFPLLEDEDDI